jgi:phenylacetate-CoA ligase
MNLKHFSIVNIKALFDGTIGIKKIVDSFDKYNEINKIAFIEESIHNMVKYCYNQVPYYKNIFNEYSINYNNIVSIDDLKKIPILDKEVVRLNYNNLRSIELKNLSYYERRSGGTTGEPIRSLVTKEARAFETFAFFRGLYYMGWNPEMTYIQVFGGSLGLNIKSSFRAKVYNFMMNSLLIPAFEIDSNNIEDYYKILNSNKNNICIIGYPSAINNIVELLKAKTLETNSVKLVITTSEQLIEDWKYNIQSYFNCQIRSYYGSGEIQSLGYQEINSDNSYLIPRDNVIIESIEKNNELIITQLHNKAQPLLRYKNGDIGVLNKNKSRIIDLIGRSADFFIRKDGTKVSPIFGTYSIQKSLIPVKKYQYIQHENLTIEFRYKMEFGNLNNSQKEKIIYIIEYVMNEKTQVFFNNSDEFEVNSSGKHRICVRKI